MTDEVMEPLTGMEFEKKKFEKRSSKKTIDFIENSAALAATPKTPDKKRKKFFFNKNKTKQDKKKVLKSELITNSIQNPSNHPIPEEKHQLEDVHMNHLSESPDVGEEANDSHSLLRHPQPVFQVTKLPPPTQTATPPTNSKHSNPEPEEVVTHDLPILSPSSQDLPAELALSKPPADPNPVLSANPSPWDPLPSTAECPIESNLGLSQSWEKCRDPHTPLSATTSNSYDSRLNSQVPLGPMNTDEFPTAANLPPRSSSHDSIPQSPLDDSQIAYSSFTDSNSQPLFSSMPKSRSHSLTNALHTTIPYLISESEFQHFSSFFSTLDPQDGLLYGEQARVFFLRSDLPNEELSRIWKLADIDNDKKLTFSEFCLAMKLVRNRKKGIPLPLTLPASILESIRTLTNSVESAKTESLPESDSPSHLSDDVPLLDMEMTGDPNTQIVQGLTEGVQGDTESLGSDPAPAPWEETDLLPSDLSRPESLEDRDQGPLDETVTVENLQKDLTGEIEDPIPKLSNSSGPIDYKDQIKSIFTPVPNPIPPPPSKTEMKQRSVLPSQEAVTPSPRIDVTPIVQMRAHTVSSVPYHNPPRHLDIAEGEEDPMILSLTSRGGSDPKDMAKLKYNRVQKRNDRISAVVLIGQEDSQISLIERGELHTFVLSPRDSEGQECIEEHFFKALNPHSTIDMGPVKFRERVSPIPSPTKISETNNIKSKRAKFKFLIGRNKKNSDSAASMENVENGESLLRKKKGKKSTKKEKSKHKRASSYDAAGKPRLYGSQNDLTSINKHDHRKMVCANTSDELSTCFSPQRSSSTLSLSPSHKERAEMQSQGDNDSFDSGGSSEELPSEGENVVRLRTHTTGSYDNRNNRSLSSPECIMSITPVPDTDNEKRYTTETDLDERTPVHQPEVLTNSQERESIQHRILIMAARCESLRGVNTDLRSEINQIRLQKGELKMQLRFRTRNYL